MKFVNDFIDCDGAPEFLVTTIGAVERISEGLVQVTYVRRKGDEYCVVAYITWELQEWARFSQNFVSMCPAILRGIEAQAQPDSAALGKRAREGVH